MIGSKFTTMLVIIASLIALYGLFLFPLYAQEDNEAEWKVEKEATVEVQRVVFSYISAITLQKVEVTSYIDLTADIKAHEGTIINDFGERVQLHYSQYDLYGEMIRKIILFHYGLKRFSVN